MEKEGEEGLGGMVGNNTILGDRVFAERGARSIYSALRTPHSALDWRVRNSCAVRRETGAQIVRAGSGFPSK